MKKGQLTKSAILDEGMQLASSVGLEGISIGNLATRMAMSKSGLYAHFKSREDLQTEIVQAIRQRLVAATLLPALEKPRGLPRLREMFRLALLWQTDQFDAGCPIIPASSDFDDRDGPVRDCLVAFTSDMMASYARLAQNCIETGDFHEDLSAKQFSFDIWSILLGFHFHHRLLRRPDAAQLAVAAFDSLVHQATRTISALDPSS